MLHKLMLAVLLVPGIAGAAADAPRLESLQIDIWPEYDRPAALVILKGELAGDVALPAQLALRIPASSGGPTAVAFAAQGKGPLLNLKHDRSPAGEFITLRFAVPERFFHVEFYDPLATGTRERAYRYVWPGDLPVEALRLAVQEPATAGGMSVRPVVGEWSTGPDGLRYRSAQLGSLARGQALPIEIGYAKSDPRTSVEILKAGAPVPGPGAVTSPEARDAFRTFLVTGAVALLVVGAALVYFLWWRPRSRAPVAAKAGGDFCGKCGHRAAAGDRFCSKCGAALA